MHLSHSRPRIHLLRPSLALAVITLGFSGCESRGRRPHPDNAQSMPVPTMDMTGQFFSGQLSVAVHLGRDSRKGPGPGGPGGGSPDNRGGPGSKGGGGGHSGMSASIGPIGMGGGGGPGGGMGGGGPGGPSEGGGDREGPPRGAGGGPGGSSAMMPRTPTLLMTLKLTNHTAALMKVEVLNFDSLLGNFAVRPALIEIPAQQTVETEPMRSQLGIPQGDLPLKVRLHCGDATEEQTLTLRITQAEDLPPPPPAR